MSRIGESSDDQRIREAQEAEYRQRVDRDKRTDQERTTKSFQEVMSQRAAREVERRTTAQSQSAHESQSQAQRGKESKASEKQKPVPGGDPRTRELQRRAAMANAQQGQLSKARTELAESATKLETDRNLDLVRGSDDERDRLRGDVERDVSRERRLEEAHDPTQVVAQAIDPDEERRQGNRGSRDGGEEGERPQAQGVTAARAEAPRGAQPAKIPSEILEHIAKSVAIAAAADGRTSLTISLKGTLLEGVTLNVTAHKGKVRCSFEGCDKQLANLIESSKGELMRQLGKRGLELDILRVK